MTGYKVNGMRDVIPFQKAPCLEGLGIPLQSFLEKESVKPYPLTVFTTWHATVHCVAIVLRVKTRQLEPFIMGVNILRIQ